MRRLFTLVACLAVTAIAAAAATAGGGVLVVGHGTAQGRIDVSVAAVSLPSGVHGQYVVRADHKPQALVQVTCLRTVGDYVLAGGHISWSVNPASVGHQGMLIIRDNPSGDSIQTVFSISGLDTCPDLTFLPMLAVDSGDFAVRPLGASG